MGESPLDQALGLHRVTDPAERLAGVLPQAAWRLDPASETGSGEVRIRVDRLNLDAASYRQLHGANSGDGTAIREAVREIIASRGKMHNPVTGSGGMLTGVVDEVGPESPLGLKPGDRVATLVSLTLTPLRIYDGLERWDGLSEQIPCDGHAILFERSIAAVLPDDLPVPLALSVMDVCGAPALTKRVVEEQSGERRGDSWRRSAGLPPGSLPKPDAPVVAILGAAGKSGSLSAAAARDAGASRIIGVVPNEAEAALLREVSDGVASTSASASAPATSSASALGLASATASVPAAASASALGSVSVSASASGARAVGPLVDDIVVADAREPVQLARLITASGGPADVTVVCVDVTGCEGGAILSTRQGGTVIFFSMATSFSAAALGAEGVAADVTMLVGNGYVPGHAEYALGLIRANGAVRALFEQRVHVAHSGKPRFDHALYESNCGLPETDITESEVRQ